MKQAQTKTHAKMYMLIEYIWSPRRKLLGSQELTLCDNTEMSLLELKKLQNNPRPSSATIAPVSMLCMSAILSANSLQGQSKQLNVNNLSINNS